MSLPIEEFRILVVDPDPIVADNLADGLRSHGCSVRAVYVSNAALITAERFRPHAMISEVIMPGMNGIDLANRFAERFPQCRVLLTSSAASVIEVMEDAIPSGILSFKRKPLQAYEVFQFVTACLPAT